MALPITGQKTPKGQQTYATHLLAPVVSIFALQNIDDPINDKYISGKQEGAWVIARNAAGQLFFAVASGPEKADKWYPAKPGSKVIPA